MERGGWRMERINTFIVDDEPLARKRIKKLLENDPEVKIGKICQNGEEAIRCINQDEPELVFLDIQMPEIDGFEVLQQLEVSPLPVVIFVTAYDEFALKAFEVHALDYLLKPFNKQRFDKALGRAKMHLRTNGESKVQQKIDGLIDALDSKTASPLKRVMVKQNGRVFFIDTHDIDYIVAAGNYMELHVGDKQYLVRETMTNMEKRLDSEQFSRIHRSTIVNIDRVKELQTWFHGDYQVELKSGEKLTMSRNYKDLLERYE